MPRIARLSRREQRRSQFLASHGTRGEWFQAHKSQAAATAENLLAAAAITPTEEGETVKAWGVAMRDCCRRVMFQLLQNEDGEERHTRPHAARCRVRACPLCSAWRSRQWYRRAFDAFPRIAEAFPGHRWILLTLTARNVDGLVTSSTRGAVDELLAAFRRMTRSVRWPAVGWLRSVEITRGKADPTTSHVHMHVLALVPPSYFSGGMITQKEWRAWWRDVAGLDYDPWVDVRAVKASAKGKSGFRGAVAEVAKYGTKPAELKNADSDWLIPTLLALKGRRLIEPAGVLRQFFHGVDDDAVDVTIPAGWVLVGVVVYTWSKVGPRWRYVRQVTEPEAARPPPVR